MVLNHIPNHTRLVVESAAPFDPEAFRHRDLNVLDVISIQNRFQKGIGKAEVQDVLHRFLAQVVIDSEDVLLRQSFREKPVELRRALEVPAEGLLYDDPGVPELAHPGELLDHRGKHARRDRQVVGRTLGAFQLRPDAPKGRGIRVVPIDIMETFRQPLKGFFVHPVVAAALDDALPGPVDELLPVEVRLRHADHGEVELAATGQGEQGGEDLLVGEVSGRPEEDQGVRRLRMSSLHVEAG
ncbi:MAG TPA: hypothetical protein RMF84_00745 [Polyangiaceae bacterium LLY-WYZ-14_1]|nr:hypothetical protein [Polyangiaceae bacterium LLY-WYZ-14_1]